MFTGSADHQPSPEESTIRVAIVEHDVRRRSRRSGPGGGVALPDLDVPDLDLTDLAPGDFDLDTFSLEDFGLPDLAQPDDEWMAQAACRGRTNLFFGIAGERPERRIRRERTARSVCDSCDVVDPCRERARAGRENGFWGGESEEERAAAGYPPRSISRRSVQQASAVRAAAS
jgi:WhiB family transcriptional regulator, redox-sensing transcriptional regulator